MPEEILKSVEAAQYLDLSTSEFYRRVQAGELKPIASVKTRGWKFRKADLDAYREAWLKTQEQNWTASVTSTKTTPEN